MNLRIATYNIHRSVGRDGLNNPARIAQVLREVDADIMALQEVTCRADAPNAVPRYLGDVLQARVIEGITLHDTDSSYGNVVLSRLPVASVNLHNISVPGREPRGAIELGLIINGHDMQCIATHLGLRAGERRYQIKRLLSLLENSPADIKILLGDLNEWFLWGRPMRWLRRIFSPMPAPATFPSRRPCLALDRLWVKPAAAVSRVYVHNSAAARVASDHLPLIVKLSIRNK